MWTLAVQNSDALMTYLRMVSYFPFEPLEKCMP